MDISAFKSWLARERNSIKVSINFFDNDENYDMVTYEYARMDELDRVVEKFESCVEGE
jgi:hypothetical protein|nr:MAG TPA_asm: hypothetical protein [Caudoviricetes sp.]